MKSDIIYLSICLLTLVLNLILIRQLISRAKYIRSKAADGCEDVITFKLEKGSGSYDDTTETILDDDTITLQ